MRADLALRRGPKRAGRARLLVAIVVMALGLPLALPDPGWAGAASTAAEQHGGELTPWPARDLLRIVAPQPKASIRTDVTPVRLQLSRKADPGTLRVTASVRSLDGRQRDRENVVVSADMHRVGVGATRVQRAPQSLVTRMRTQADGEYTINVTDPTTGAFRAFPGVAGQHFQVVVLDAIDLSLVDNESFPYLGPAWSRPGAAPADPLKGLLTTAAPGASTTPIQTCQQRGGCVVVVQSPSSFATGRCPLPGACTQPTNPGDSLAAFGGTRALAAFGGTRALDAIGVTTGAGKVGYSLVSRVFLDGTLPSLGGGHERIGCLACVQNPVVVPSQSGAADAPADAVGRISGVLIADQLNNLSFHPHDFVGGASGPLTPVAADIPYTIGLGTPADPVRIGSKTFTADPSVENGFLVLTSAGGTAPTWSATTFADTDLSGLWGLLSSLEPDALFVLRTVGQPTVPPNDHDTYRNWLTLTQWQATSELFASLTGSDDLVIVHASGAFVGLGLPADQLPSSVGDSSLLYRAQRATAPPGPTRMAGVLRRDNRGIWRSAVQTPLSGPNPGGDTTAALKHRADRDRAEPHSRRLLTAPGQQNAYAWVGSWILNGKQYDQAIDIRAAYPQLSSAALQAASSDTITMPTTTTPPFTASDLAAVAQQVQLELLNASRAVKVLEDIGTVMAAFGPEAGNDMAAAVDR